MTKDNKIIRGAGGGGCFTGDTKVSTPFGYKKINEIKKGDFVLSFDDKGEIYQAKVLEVFKHENEEVWEYNFWGGSSFIATPNHWILNQFNAFVGVGTLDKDDCAVNQNNHLVPFNSKKKIGYKTVYNLNVENQHTFIANNIRVHNAGLGLGITGAGGGGGRKGGGGRTPTRTPDTLHSRQFATILDLFSEGEIEGSATASKDGFTNKSSQEYRNSFLKDIFLNNTPILKSSASASSPSSSDFNFTGFKDGDDISGNFKFRVGISPQTPIPGIKSSQSTSSVGVTVTASTPVTRQITNTNVDAIRVSITFPQLQKITDQGDVLGSSVELKIAVQYNSGGFTDVIQDTITGRTADPYQKDYRVNITGSFPVDIRVIRVTADSTDSGLVDAFQFTSFTEVIDQSFRYNNSAYTALRIDAQEFSSIPSRIFRIRGIKVRIPGAGASGSGTPGVDSATGRIVYPSGYIFNGVMGAAVYTNCPAMCLLDLLTNTRYGFGDHITDSSLDLFSFVNASKFANTLVSDGRGGQEARFSCNVNIQSPSEAFDLINDLAGVMRCMPIWSAGSITITQDKPTDASYLFNLSNVGEKGFSYSGSSAKTRSSVVSVSYFNMDSREIDYEVVEDTALINKIGHIVKQVKGFACTSRGQAARLGRAILFSEANETEICTFTTSIDSGAIVRPGAVIEINDPVRAGVRRGGRLKSVTSTTVVTVDDTSATDLTTANNATLGLILPNGTFESRSISSISGGTITVSSAYSQTPNVNTVWLLENTTVKAQLFRVINVEEEDGINYKITALSYVNEKYNFIENNLSIPARDVTNLDQLTDPPSNLVAVEKMININNQASSKIIISWQPIIGVFEYQVNYRYENNNFISEKVSRPDFEILNNRKGKYEIQVFSYNVRGQLSATSSDLTFNSVGNTSVPDDVTNLQITQVSSTQALLNWTQSTSIDVISGGSVVIKHSTKTNATFADAVSLLTVAGNSTSANVPAITGKYFVVFENIAGKQSANPASVVLTAITGNHTLILDRKEDTDNPTFQGTFSNLEKYNPPNYPIPLTGIVLKGNILWDSVSNVDNLVSWDFPNDVLASGEYEFNNVLDLEEIHDVLIERRLSATGFNVSTGSAVSDVDAKIFVSTTNDDPNSGSATFSAFQEFGKTLLKARGFKFKVVLSSSNTTSNICVTELGFKMFMTSSTQFPTSQIASGTAQKAVTFPNKFFTGVSVTIGGVNGFVPIVNANIVNIQTGDTIAISSITKSGFNADVKDSGGNFVNRNFVYQANGLR